MVVAIGYLYVFRNDNQIDFLVEQGVQHKQINLYLLMMQQLLIKLHLNMSKIM